MSSLFSFEGRNAVLWAAAAFACVTGVGTATSYFRYLPEPTVLRETDDDVLARLKTYARAIKNEAPVSAAASGDMLPDVNTMIAQLAARLQSAPDDVRGWRMLGWSHFNTGGYEQAAAAYGKAVELDPDSAELKAAYEQARAKASEGAASGPKFE